MFQVHRVSQMLSTTKRCQHNMVSDQKQQSHYFLKLCRCHSSSSRQNLLTHIIIYSSKVSHFPVCLIRGDGVQLTGTADHVSQAVTVQGGQTRGAGGHSTRPGDQGQGTVSQESAEVIIPSLQAPSSSSEINMKVSQWYQELEDSA